MSNTQNQSVGMSQLQKLQALKSQAKAQAKVSNMTNFENIVGIYLGTEPTLHFPKLFDENGNKVKDEKETINVQKRLMAGHIHLLNFKHVKKIKIVLQKQFDFKLLSHTTSAEKDMILSRQTCILLKKI